MSEQELTTEQIEEQTPDPLGEVAEDPSYLDRLNAAMEEHYSKPDDGEELPDEEDASTEPSDEEAPEEDEGPSSSPQESSQTEEEDPDVEYGRRVAAVLRSRPDLAEALVAIERGEVVPIPRQVFEQTQNGQQQPQEPERDPLDDIYEDPFKAIATLKGEIDAFKAYQQQQLEQARAAEDRQHLSLIESVGEEFRASHPELSQEQFFSELIPDIAQTNLIVKYRAKHPGDPKAAVKEAFEAAFRMNYPELASKQQIDRQVRENRRARRAGATAASPRSVQRTTEEPKNKQERLSAMADMIREAESANA